ncbi:hypothetical protein FC84_GL001086 [Lapidilactobacillus dextrinicus DSM 20335]|uniref:Integral membrane protein n=1 Tax=Lapidilactobacillus dextrinicus DSM 20335 TaxID=1423738 RepID=A0A0R2BJS6_9LACO|nr:DUF624 domain-containing protein [Lapidilactobacillus dextrinicus]KRM79617.1 hypothetical protein FC84_GL001086 [Lapidilactobacillus dextrinicus DSM 20335]QFG47406.1 DUF624 domain-containing protein [Lapidilactobacillus dextrinicus]
MIGQTAQNVFIKVYVIFLMTIYFWIFTVAGLVVLGIGPSLRAVTEMFMDNQWQYQNYHLKDAWHQFKTNFWQINLHAWLFLGILALLAYNLYLSTQIKEAWILIIQFVIIFAIAMAFSLGIFTLLIRSRYDVSFVNALKLATAQFFSNFSRLLLFLIMTIALIMAAAKWPGIILFLAPGAYIVFANWFSRKWYKQIDNFLS